MFKETTENVIKLNSDISRLENSAGQDLVTVEFAKFGFVAEEILPNLGLLHMSSRKKLDKQLKDSWTPLIF